MNKSSFLLILWLFSLPLIAQKDFRKSQQKMYRELTKEHIYSDFENMYREPSGIAFKYPYIAPGSKQYAAVLWDWDSWWANVALRQILADAGGEAERSENACLNFKAKPSIFGRLCLPLFALNMNINKSYENR